MKLLLFILASALGLSAQTLISQNTCTGTTGLVVCTASPAITAGQQINLLVKMPQGVTIPPQSGVQTYISGCNVPWVNVISSDTNVSVQAWFCQNAVAGAGFLISINNSLSLASYE